METKPPIDWLRVVVRFLCGAVLGFILGLGFWLRFWDAGAIAWLLVVVSAVAFGAAAAYWGDSFWHSLRDWIWWAP